LRATVSTRTISLRAISLRTIALPAALLACVLGATLLGCSGASTAATTAPTGPGLLSLPGSTTGAAQVAGLAIIPVTRTGGSTGAVTVTYATTNGTAIAGTDYTAASGLLSWADGDSSTKDIYVTLSTTPIFYGSRNFTLTLSAPSGSATLNTSTTLVGIAGALAAPVAGTLAFSPTTASASVLNGSVAVTVARTVGSSGAISVNYATASGTAAAGIDYTTTSGTLNWADGDATAKIITIPLNTSVSFSGTLTFTVALSSPAGVLATPTLGTASTITVSLTAGPPEGVLGFSSATTAITQTTGVTPLTTSISVARTIGTTGAVSISYSTANGTAIAGTDYTATSGSLSWATGDSTPKMISIPINTTYAFNGTKTFTVALTAPTGSASLGTTASNAVTITGSWAAAPSSCTAYNFSPWNITLPIDQYGGTGGTNGIQYAAASETTAQIKAGFADSYFFADASCNIVFTAPSNGAVTTPGSGSDHTRSELRELYTGTGADSNSDWNSSIGGTLTASGKLLNISANSDISTIGQVHGQTYVFMLLAYRSTYNDIIVDIYTTNTSTSGHVRTSLIQNVHLGDSFRYSINYSGSTMTVTAADGSNTNTMSFPIDPSWAGTGVYFKAGAYHSVSNTGNPAGDQTQTSFSAFAVTHP